MLGQPLSMLVPQVVGFKLERRAAGGCDRHRPGADGDRDPAQDRRRRKVRRVLRRGRHVAAARRPRDAREHVARVRGDVRLLPRRPDDARLPEADRPQPGAHRARRGVLQGEPPLARPVGPCDLLAGRRARPGRRRALARRAAPTAGPRAARLGEAVVHRHARLVRRRLQERLPRPGGRRHVPRLATRRPSSSPAGSLARRGRRRHRGARAASPRARSRLRLRARPRLGRDHRDHLVHEHVEPAGDGRRGPARAERGRARTAAQAVGQVVARTGLEGRDALLRAGRPADLPRPARLQHRRVRLHDVHRQLGAARRRDLGRDRRGRPRRLLGALRQPQLRGADPPRGEGELPGVAAARRRVRACRSHGHRLRDRADRSCEDGGDVYLRDIWPSAREIGETIASSVRAEQFSETYDDVFSGDDAWRALPVPEGQLFRWEPGSTYVRQPPYFEGMSREPGTVADVADARVLVWLGDSVTTDHISPAGRSGRTRPQAPTSSSTGSSARTSTRTARGAATTR